MAALALRLRLPWWVSGPAEVTLNGTVQAAEVRDGYLVLHQVWSKDNLHLTFPKALVAVPLPDEPGLSAFMDGPVVLAGLNPGGGTGAAASKEPGSHTARSNYHIDGMRFSATAAPGGALARGDRACCPAQP